jgi:DNA helicase-2/ATP-dependent DNA helicase PcrA
MCKDYLRNHIRADKRIDKNIESHKEEGEIIEEYIGLDLSRVLEFIRRDKFTFILTRTNYYKKVLIDEVFVPNGIVYHEIRGKSIWNDRTIHLYNACFRLLNKMPLEGIEVEYLIKNIPFKLGLLKKGTKSNYKSLMNKEKYSISDMLEIGFNFNLFNLDSYDKLFNVLDITDSLKKTFLAKPTKLIEYPIRLKIGTIHSSKGKEAEDVILFKDVSRRVALEASKDKKSWEDEIRVFYVGQSRSKERLVILRGGFRFGEPDFIP